jgi:hypothetical protein
MAFAEMLAEGERRTRRPEWTDVQEALSRVSDGRSMSLLLEGVDDAWLSVSYAEGHGVQVMAMEDGELGERVLVDATLPTELVPTRVGGLPQREPRSTLVSKEVAIEAAREFLETGKRSVSLTWMDPLDLEREASGPRDEPR